MEFAVSRHADKLVIFFSYNCLSVSQQVSRDAAEMCSVACISLCPRILKRWGRDFRI